jgi:hypothetical protein
MEMIKIYKKILSLILVIFIIASLLIGCGATEEPKNSEDNEERISDSYNSNPYSSLLTKNYNGLDLDKVNKYIIDVEFNPEDKAYSAEQTVFYINNEEVDLDKIYFHIYPNAFREKDTAPFLFDSYEDAYPYGFKPGYIEIYEISVDGKKISNFNIKGKGNTILEIPLENSLKPGQKTEVYMKYHVVLPPAQDRFGYGEKTFNLGNWYPIAAVYDDEGWNLDPYYSIGDPFYSDIGNYEVTIKAPKDIVIATSGSIIDERIQGDNKIWEIEAVLVRDFAWVASEHFTKVERNVDGTTVKLYFLENNSEINKFAVDVSCNAVEIFNDVFGKYPYKDFSVVATSFPSGMEYPGIVFIGDKYYSDDYKGYLEIVIVHETAHQWWYGVVGNDEVDEAWLDESITTYSEVIYADEKYGDKVAEEYYQNNIEGGYRYRKSLIQSNEVVVKSLNKFTDWNDYGALVYDKGAMFIHEIEREYGEEVLYKTLKEYYNNYRFLNATTEDFIKVCETVIGEELDEKVEFWLYGR